MREGLRRQEGLFKWVALMRCCLGLHHTSRRCGFLLVRWRCSVCLSHSRRCGRSQSIERREREGREDDMSGKGWRSLGGAGSANVLLLLTEATEGTNGGKGKLKGRCVGFFGRMGPVVYSTQRSSAGAVCRVFESRSGFFFLLLVWERGMKAEMNCTGIGETGTKGLEMGIESFVFDRS